MSIPPPPPGFKIINGAGPAPAPALGGRPIIRRGAEPKAPQAKVIKDGYLVDPNTGTATPIAGLPASTSEKVTFRTLTPAEVSAQGLTPGVYQQGSDGKLNRIGDAPAQDALTPEQKNELRAESLGKIKLARSLKDRSATGWFTTGFGADTMRNMSQATPAGGVAADVETLRAAGALQRIMELTQRTGKNPLTPISNADFKALGDSLSNLDVGQPDAQFQRNVQTAEDMYRRAFLAAGGTEEELNKLLAGEGEDEKKDEKPVAPAMPAASGSGGGGTYALADLPPPPGNLRDGFDPKMDLTPPDGEVFRGWNLRNGVATPVFGPPKQRDKDSNGVVSAIDAAARGAADTLTFGLADKAAALVDTIGGGTFNANLIEQNAVSDADEKDRFGYRLGGQVAGGFGLPTFGIRSAKGLAGLGGGYGGAYGIGSSDSLDEVPENAALGAGTGAIFGYLGGKAAAGMGRRSRKASEATFSAGQEGGDNALGNLSGRQVYDAGKRLGIDVLPADVGGATTRRLTAGAMQSPFAAQPISKAAERVTSQAQGARDRIASTVGNAGERELIGEQAKAGAEGFIKRTSKAGNDLYRRAETLAGDARVPLPRALQVLDQNIAELSEVPGGADGLAALGSLREELASGAFTINGIRGMRTQLRDKFVKDGLTGSDLERRVNQVINAATDDMADGLKAQGKGNAAGVYKQADRYWRMRMETIDRTIKPVIGDAKSPKSGEQVMQALETAAKGNNAKLSRFMQTLEPAEQANVRATVISNLGKANPGGQDAAGQAFSLPQFLSHWNQLTPGAKRTLFQGEVRAALDDLAKVAQGSKEAQRFQNHSNTAGAIGAQAAIVGAPLALGNPLASIVGMGGQYLTGKVLASPRFARWLVGAKSTRNPQAHIKALSKVATAEPAIGDELRGLAQSLLSGANDNVGSAAAASESGEQKR